MMTIQLPFAIELVLRHPQRFWWAFVFVLVYILVALELRKRKNALRDPWIALHISTSHLPTTFHHIRWWVVWGCATGLIIIAYVNPERILYEWERVFERIRITFILDVSHSAKKAEDILPNRLEAEKAVVRDFVEMLERDDELKGKYHLALIPFSGAALPYYLPFTTSRDEFLSHLDAIDTDTVTRKGTSLWAALRAYDELLILRPSNEKGTVDLGILISDGGKEEGKRERALLSRTIDDLRDSYRLALFTLAGERIFVRSKKEQRRVVLNTIGIGRVDVDGEGRRTAKPAFLVNRDRAGNFMGYEHVKENDLRSPVLTSTLDEQILREVAERAGGVYRHFSNRESVLREFKAFILSHRSETSRIPHPRYESVRWWFLVPAFVMYYFLFGYGGWIFWLLRRIPAVSRFFSAEART